MIGREFSLSTVQAEPTRAANMQMGRMKTLSEKDKKALGGNIRKKASRIPKEALNAPSSWNIGTRGEPRITIERTPIIVTTTETKKIIKNVASNTRNSLPLSFNLYVPNTLVKNKKGKREYLPNLIEMSCKKFNIEDAIALFSGNKKAIVMPSPIPIKYLIHIFIN